MSALFPTLVDTDWLASHLDDPEMRVLDASWHLPTSGRVPRSEYLAEHIPGAGFFDLDACSDAETDLPHMLPAAELFAQMMGSLGVSPQSWVVVYDTAGMFSAARLWWMLRISGHLRVSVLQGGLLKWRAEQKPLRSGPESIQSESFEARFDAQQVLNWQQVQQRVSQSGTVLLDARSAPRFAGEVPEPRPGLRSGHIPGAKNLPFNAILDEPYQTLLGPEKLKQIFSKVGVTSETSVVCSCGSGVTACVLALGLHLCGIDKIQVYDGSWAEWGGRADLPVATGSS